MKQPFQLNGLLIVILLLVHSLDVAVTYAAESGNFAGLVDIGSGRKMYLECSGSGSPTVVLISGTRGANDDWTHLVNPTNPVGVKEPSELAVFPRVGRITHVCVYDRPG